MERRNKSIEALNRLIYIDSLDPDDRAIALIVWSKDYLEKSSITELDLKLEEFKQLSELFFKNINFMKKHKEDTRKEILKTQKLQKFLKH